MEPPFLLWTKLSFHTAPLFFGRAGIKNSSTHFWNVSWQTMKFFDEVLPRIYVHRKEKLKNKPVAFVTTAQIEPSARRCLESMSKAFNDLQARVIAKLMILDGTDQRSREKKIQAFVNKISRTLCFDKK